MPDTLTPQEREAIVAFEASGRVRKIERGVSGIDNYSWAAPENARRGRGSKIKAGVEALRRNAAIIRDAPSMTVRELVAKHGASEVTVRGVLRAASVSAKAPKQ